MLAWWDWSHEWLRIALPDFRTLAVGLSREVWGLVVNSTSRTQGGARVLIACKVHQTVIHRRDDPPA